MATDRERWLNALHGEVIKPAFRYAEYGAPDHVEAAGATVSL
jgi:hypothetical protein